TVVVTEILLLLGGLSQYVSLTLIHMYIQFVWFCFYIGISNWQPLMGKCVHYLMIPENAVTPNCMFFLILGCQKSYLSHNVYNLLAHESTFDMLSTVGDVLTLDFWYFINLQKMKIFIVYFPHLHHEHSLYFVVVRFYSIQETNRLIFKYYIISTPLMPKPIAVPDWSNQYRTKDFLISKLIQLDIAFAVAGVVQKPNILPVALTSLPDYSAVL
ncbi:hypothetical protein ACJX0J_020197, partial [Zea mays]